MARLKDKSRIERSRKNLPANFIFAKKEMIHKKILWDSFLQISQK